MSAKKLKYKTYKWTAFPSNWFFAIFVIFLGSIIYFFFTDLSKGINLANDNLEEFYKQKNSATDNTFDSFSELTILDIDWSTQVITNNKEYTFKKEDNSFYKMKEKRGRKLNSIVNNEALYFKIIKEGELFSKVFVDKNQQIELLGKFYTSSSNLSKPFLQSYMLYRDKTINNLDNLKALYSRGSDGEIFLELFFSNGNPYKFSIYSNMNNLKRNQPRFELIFDIEGKLIKSVDTNARSGASDFTKSYIYDGYLNFWKLNPKQTKSRNETNNIDFKLKKSEKLFNNGRKYIESKVLGYFN